MSALEHAGKKARNTPEEKPAHDAYVKRVNELARFFPHVSQALPERILGDQPGSLAKAAKMLSKLMSNEVSFARF